MLTTNEIGRAGEHRVISELLLRGHRPLVAVVDEGADLILSDGLTVQVKATAAKIGNNCRYANGAPRTYYQFRFHSKIWRNGRAIVQRGLAADVAICWAIPEDRFWIVPASAIGDRNYIAVPVTMSERSSRWHQFESRWDLLRTAEPIDAPRMAQETEV